MIYIDAFRTCFIQQFYIEVHKVDLRKLSKFYLESAKLSKKERPEQNFRVVYKNVKKYSEFTHSLDYNFILLP